MHLRELVPLWMQGAMDEETSTKVLRTFRSTTTDVTIQFPTTPTRHIQPLPYLSC